MFFLASVSLHACCFPDSLFYFLLDHVPVYVFNLPFLPFLFSLFLHYFVYKRNPFFCSCHSSVIPRSLFSSSPPTAVSVFLISAPSVSLPIVHLVINRLHIIFFLKLPFIPTFTFSSSSRQLSVPFTHAFRLTQLLSHTCIFSCCVSVSSVVSRPSIHAGVTHEQNTFPFRMLTRYAPVLNLRICRCSHPPVFTQMYTTVSLL